MYPVDLTVRVGTSDPDARDRLVTELRNLPARHTAVEHVYARAQHRAMIRAVVFLQAGTSSEAMDQIVDVMSAVRARSRIGFDVVGFRSARR